MVTIKQALTNRHSSNLCRTIVGLSTGEAFKWRPGGKYTRSDNWCVKLSHLPTIRVQNSTTTFDTHNRECKSWETQQHLWMYIEGTYAGIIFYDDGTAEVYQP